MGRWRPLAAELPMEHRRLVQRLRALKDRAGLSYSALAGKSSPSAASWHRYLNASAFPPWDAVSALCRLAGGNAADLARLRVLWDAAGDPRLPAPPTPPGTPDRPGEPPPENVRPPTPPSPPSTSPQTVPLSPPARSSPFVRSSPAASSSPVVSSSQAARRRPPARSLRGAATALTLALMASVPASTVPEASAPKQTWPVPARLSPSTAAAPAPCTGSSCAGLDAARTGCVHDRRVLGSYVRDGHRAQLLHSPGCSAVWGEAAPPERVRGLTLSVRGAGQDHEPAGTDRTRMTPAPETMGTNLQFCAIFRDFQSCIDAGNRVWSGTVRPESSLPVTARRSRTP